MRFLLWNDKNILKLDSGVSLTTCEYTKTKTWTVTLKRWSYDMWSVSQVLKCVIKNRCRKYMWKIGMECIIRLAATLDFLCVPNFVFLKAGGKIE